MNDPISIFTTVTGDIFVGMSVRNSTVKKWTSNSTTAATALDVNDRCVSLFVDTYDGIYCSIDHLHIVVKRSINDDINVTSLVAGNGTCGSDSVGLCSPHGLFVDTYFNLYVTDTGNNRIQLFRPNELNGTTVVGGSVANSTIVLSNPVAIILDVDGYLFIVDQNNNRIVAGGSTGYRCIVGCSNTSGAADYQLDSPHRLSFDSYGNIFVTDANNHRVQKFLLSSNTCGR